MSREDLLLRLRENAKVALLHSIRSKLENPNQPRNTSIIDCAGSSVCYYAVEALSVTGRAPEKVLEFIRRQANDERLHCSLALDKAPNALMDTIREEHSRTIRQKGWAAWFGAMQLGGEVLSLGTAFALKAPDDPHSRPEGFSDEFWHITGGLLMLALYATDDELQDALASQEEFLRRFGVPITQPA